MQPVIRIEGVSKRYRIGGLHPGYMTLREVLGGVLLAPFRGLGRAAASGSQTLWALSDLNLEVGQGELVGIVGHNGAGKSTLLKILSRITRPTKGRALIRGRVGSLLEVGTGFHPDLTGRENVYLSGAILGMTRAEIERKFDEIVAFSELEKFVETPVKWYSSGMYVRLAFAVAAHLEPEILIMDEVLAVGDVAFQMKCLDKMHEIRRQGRTVLFVSHNMPAVTRLCRRAVWLDRGMIVRDGPAQEVVNAYTSASWDVAAERVWPEAEDASGAEAVAAFRRARVRTEEGATTPAADIRRAVGIEVTYDVLRPGHVLAPVVDVYSEDGAHLFSARDVGPEWRGRTRPVGTYTSVVWVPGNFLAEGSLLVNVSLMSQKTVYAQQRNALAFQVVDSLEGDSARGDYVGPMPGLVRPLLDWTTLYDAGGSDVSPSRTALDTES